MVYWWGIEAKALRLPPPMQEREEMMQITEQQKEPS